jgi:hypothetical protein
MDSTVVSINANTSATRQGDVFLGLASAVAFAAAGSLLGYSLLSKKRRVPVSGQLLLGVVAGCAGMVTWKKRQQEIDAARHLMEHVHEVRDTRWLKKHPVAYG